MPSKRDRKCRLCPTLIARETRTGLCSSCFTAERRAQTPSARLQADQDRNRLTSELTGLRSKYAEALKTIERQDSQLGWLAEIREGASSTYEITPREGSGTSEATPVIVASDWHSEEIVKPAQVRGKNEFNPEICTKRVEKFWQSSLRLIRLLSQDVKIHQVVLALLGDFITNQIHGADNAENNAKLPVHAAIDAWRMIASGIEFLLNHSDFDLLIPCKVGNHSRITQKVRHASEAGHSLETMVYAFLVDHFRGNERVQFVFDEGYHTVINVYNKTLRFHHGHDIQYQGGIGGLFIPAYKAISQWNKAEKVDLDIFGHFHQTKDGGNFLCNGSLIGYNAFAVAIKADYEPPQQTLLLIDKKRGKTCNWPILLEQAR